MKKPENMSFEELMKELNQLGNSIDDELNVEKAISSYERGVEVIAELNKRIDEAEQKVTKIKQKS